MTWPVWCPTCRKRTGHTSNGAELACEDCFTARPDDVPLLVSQVQDMRPCGYCRETLPADHDCPAGAVGCTAGRADGTTCGECGPCLDAQRSDPRYGSLNDLDIP